jgi:molybdate transport system substrate-binding protein
MKRIFLVCWVAGLVGCGGSKAESVSVFAAASTQETVQEVARAFEASTGTPVRCSFAASSVLARQIDQGAAADLFLSADERWADYLEERGLAGRRRDLLGNRLVVVTPADRPLALGALADLDTPRVEHLALALDSVPAGRYARRALGKAGVWGRVEGRVREAGDVRAALNYVARGEAEAGFVYATDAATTTKVKVALTVPEDLHSPIRYPLVLLRSAGGPQGDTPRPAQRLYDYLGGEEAAAIFGRAGFTVLKP